MATFDAVTTVKDLASLDQGEIVEGYMDGLDPDTPAPGENRGRSYWHGWQNGRADRENRSRPESIKLIKDMRRLGMMELRTVRH